MRVIGYCRVSTTGQSIDGVSLDAQRGRIEAWCAARGRALEPSDLFLDAGVSGKRSDNRPGLRAAVDAACRSKGVLVVYSLSRLARSVKDSFAIAERLEKAGANLVSLTESIDTTSATGKMFFGLIAVLAAFERDLVAERTRAALAYKRSKGERISGRVPFGKTLAIDGRTLLDAPAELAALTDARRWRAEGWTFRRIADELTRLGVPTRTGRPWAISTIQSLVRRPG